MGRLLRLPYNALRFVPLLAWRLFQRIRHKPARWVVLRLRGRVSEIEGKRAALLRALLRGFRPRSSSVSEVRKLCEQLIGDPRAQGLLVYVSSLEGGWATLSSLRAELVRLRGGQKRVIAFLPDGASQREIFVASAADAIVTPQVASFSALGPMAARAYVAPLLDKAGIRVDVLAQGSYKTAAEPLVRSEMSEPEREQLTAIVSTLADSWTEKLAERPKLGEAGGKALLEAAYFGARRAEELGLVDACRYEDELASYLELSPGEKPRPARAYRAEAPSPLFVPLKRRPRVAIVRLEGTITEQHTGRSVAQGAAIAVLRALAEHPIVHGVILYIDSPGGSAVASDLIHREVQRLDAVKPTLAWLGNVAASGGYYLAAGARHIVAQPTTLTGSIGVIAARPAAHKLFERLGVKQEIVKVAPHADMHSLTRELDAEERAILLGETRRFYDRFLDVVSEGRKRPRDEIEGLAGGRVWSGRDAHARGLVDTLGGYREARAGLDALLPDAAAIDPEPLIVSLPRREVTPGLPARAALASLGGSEGLLALEQALELLQLCAGRTRVLAYAHALPNIS